MMTMDGAKAGLAARTTSIAPVRATMTTGAMKAGAAGARMTMTIVAPLLAGVAMADGRAIPRAIPRLRAVAGKTAGRT
jgi:hypothetical protein